MRHLLCSHQIGFTTYTGEHGSSRHIPYGFQDSTYTGFASYLAVTAKEERFE